MINIVVSVAMIKEILEYTEYMEVEQDGEWGNGRSFEELVEKKMVPDWYEPLKDKVKREMSK